MGWHEHANWSWRACHSYHTICHCPNFPSKFIFPENFHTIYIFPSCCYFKVSGRCNLGISPVWASQKWQHQRRLIKQKRNGRWFSPPSSFGSFARKELSKFLTFRIFSLFLLSILGEWGFENFGYEFKCIIFRKVEIEGRVHGEGRSLSVTCKGE